MGDDAVRRASPSSGPSGHLLPQGEKGRRAWGDTVPKDAAFPSPLVGEGGARSASGEGGDARSGLLLGHARHMRRHPTDAEQRMWHLLRNRRLSGLKFRRQVPIGRYIVGFVSYSGRLVVELDGSQHAESKRDRVRDADLKDRGFEVLRFWNADVLLRSADVLETVWQRARQKGAL